MGHNWKQLMRQWEDEEGTGGTRIMVGVRHGDTEVCRVTERMGGQVLWCGTWMVLILAKQPEGTNEYPSVRAMCAAWSANA